MHAFVPRTLSVHVFMGNSRDDRTPQLRREVSRGRVCLRSVHVLLTSRKLSFCLRCKRPWLFHIREAVAFKMFFVLFVCSLSGHGDVVEEFPCPVSSVFPTSPHVAEGWCPVQWLSVARPEPLLPLWLPMRPFIEPFPGLCVFSQPAVHGGVLAAGCSSTTGAVSSRSKRCEC